MFYRVSNGGSGEIQIPVSISWHHGNYEYSSNIRESYDVSVTVGNVSYTFKGYQYFDEHEPQDYMQTFGSDSRTVTITPL